MKYITIKIIIAISIIISLLSIKKIMEDNCIGQQGLCIPKSEMKQTMDDLSRYNYQNELYIINNQK